MKRLLLLLLCLFTMGTAWSRDTLRLDLSQPTIPDVLEFDPATGHWVDTYDEFAALQFNGMFNMSRMSDSYGNFYWHGFSVGTNGDITNYGVAGSSDGWVANQWGCMAGGGIKTNAQGWVVKDAQGHIESELGNPYLIGTGNPWMGGPDRIIAIDLTDGVARQALGIYVCNHPWPYYGNINGDGFARPLDQPGDYFHLVAHGEQADGTETTVTYVLAEYRDGELHQSDRWNYFDLRSLGEVVSIWFTFETTDVGAYGPNTAAYVCLDRLELLEPQVATPVQVTVVMNPVSNLMKLHNKATSAEVNVGSPMGPPQGNAPKTYRFNTLPGTYTLTGYAPDGTTVIGSIDIEITEEASQTISIYAATASATNSGWALGTDYSVVLKSLSGSNGSVRTFTTGNDNTGKLSFLLLNGDTYVIDLVPSAAKQADGYMTKTLTGTLNGNGTITGEITMGGNYNITVPEGVSVFVGTKPKHYVPFAEVQPESVSTSGGKTVYAYSLANNTQYNYRVSQPGKLTHGGIFYMNSDATKRPTLVFTEADMNRAAPTFVDREVSGSKVADIFLNINERHHLRMNVGGEHKMLAQRNWQLVANPIDNYFIEPDYRYTVLNINGQPDQSVVRVENIKGINTVKAVGNGTAIVLVSYDAIYLEQYQRNSALPTAFAAGSLNGAIWPENTGVFVVTVGDQPSGITSNMLINEGRNTTQHKLAGDAVDAEHDVFYYLAPDQGYSYTFKPTGVASVAIAKPTLGANMATYDGFETVQPNADGSYTVLLTHGRSIVRLTNAQGVSDYQVLTAKQAEFTITNLTNNGKPVIPGDQVEILLGGLYHPANKQAGTYNMSAQVEYTSPVGNHTANGGQYSFASTAKKFKLTIPADWDVDASNRFIITDGTIKSGGFGDPYGNHRNVSPSEGRAPNFTALLHPAWFGALPDIRVKVQKTAECQDVMDSYTVNACGSYEWEGKTYTESGIYTINGQTHCGADHIKTLHLTINQPVNHEFSEVACGSYDWNGTVYDASGDYVQTLTAANGCDSTVTLHLTIATDCLEFSIAMDGNPSTPIIKHSPYSLEDALAGITLADVVSIEVVSGSFKTADWNYLKSKRTELSKLKRFSTSSGAVVANLPNTTKGNPYFGAAIEDVCLYGVGSVGNYAFAGCASLTKINLPNLQAIAADGVFSNCQKLNTVELPECTRIDGDDAFKDCKALATVHMPKLSVIKGSYAFAGCQQLASISLPELVTIGGGALDGWATFDQCVALSSVDMPKLQTISGMQTFFGCSQLTAIDFPSLTSLAGSQTFASCTKLTTATLPQVGGNIGSYAFRNCGSLVQLHLGATPPIANSTVFEGCPAARALTLVAADATPLTGDALASAVAAYAAADDNTADNLWWGWELPYIAPVEWTLVGGVAINSSNNCENTSVLSDGGYFHAVIAKGDMQWQRGYIHVFSNHDVTWSLESVVGEIVQHDYNEYWGGAEKTKWCQMPYNYGTFTLVATRTDNGEQQRIHVIVEETLSADPIGLSGVSLSETSKQLTVGEQFTLIPVFAPADASNKQVEWSSSDATVASVAGGVVTAVGAGSATITVTAKDGGHTATCDVTVAAAASAPTVYFVHIGGHKQLLDASNIMELNVLNTGRFYFEGEGCTVLDKWEGREETLQGGWHYWLDQWSDDFTSCRFNPRTTTDGRQITITYIQNGATKTLSFTLRVVASAIEEIKAYVGTTELSMDNPYVVQGNERTYITVKGRYANATDWVELPESAYRIADSDKVHVLDNSFSLWMTGEYVLTVEMKDSDLKLDFKVISAFVPLTDFTVLAPATWTIEKWNTLSDKYMGISEVDMADKDNGYVLTFAPENASNTELEWEALTPDVAVFDPLHSNGIVPSKAGEARFRVRSVSNPELVREVAVTFVYKHPLLAVSGPSELHLNAGDEFDLGAQLAFNPANATEQRLEFTYSSSGIVDAACAVEVAGGVGQHTTKHTLTALANGVATLTCTPFDQSAGAEAFDIIVRVGSYTLNYTATNGGSISGAATQNVPHGLSGVEVAAVPEEGFKFLRWSDGRTDNPRIDVNVEENVSVTAEFVPENTTIYTLLYTATEGGSISGAAQQSVAEGQNGVAVTAVPNKGYRFVQWSDGRTEATRMEENVTSDMTIEAEFIKQIRVDYLAAANGRIDGPAAQIVDRGVATEAVTATADEGYRFVRWSDGRTEATRADIIDANIDDTTFVAQFELIRYELTISVLGDDDQPIAGAKVTLGGKDYTTDAKGVVVDTLLPETYAYTVECEGYNAKSGEVVLNSDTLVKVVLSKTPSTGLRSIERESLSAYPNPTTGELWLTVPEPVEGTVEGAAAEVLVYSINGQLMLRVPMRASASSAPAVAGSAPAAGRIRIDLSGLPAGVYIIRVGNAVAKVVRL